MATICIFGNSHLGALAQAEAGNRRFASAGHDLFYWGAAGGNFPRLSYADGVVTSPHPPQALQISGGRCAALEIAPLDILVCYGMHVGLSYQARRVAAAMAAARDTSAAFRAALLAEQLDGWWQEQPAPPLMAAIRRDHPGLRMLFYPQPLVARHDGFFRDPAAAREAQEALSAHAEAWCAAHDIEARRQPAATIVDALHTDPALSRGSVKLGTDEAHPGDDHRHMNAAYGEALMADLFASATPVAQYSGAQAPDDGGARRQTRRQRWPWS